MDNDELTTLREAHNSHRLQVATMLTRIARLESVVGTAGPVIGQRLTLIEQVDELRRKDWSTEDARAAVKQLQQLSEAMYAVFNPPSDEA